MTFPSYNNLRLDLYKKPWGYYALGIINYYRSDIELIDIRLDIEKTAPYGQVELPASQVDYDWLQPKIESALANKKCVALIVEDEHVYTERNDQLISVLNQYADDPVYWCTQFTEQESRSIYRSKHQLKIKILELPWLLFNEAITYSFVADKNLQVEPDKSAYNFLSMSGRFEPHKNKLLEELHNKSLDQYGLLTIPADDYLRVPYGEKPYCKLEHFNPYADVPVKKHDKMAAQFCVDGVWISNNVKNFLYVEQAYKNIPLVVHPETEVQNFFVTEKSIWPTLTGKLPLIYGQRHVMKYVQRFTELDLSKIFNLEFDSIIDHNNRLDMLLTKNSHLIKNCKDVYYQFREEIYSSKQQMPAKLYDYFVNQISKII
jgi:hypothetical protein